MQTTAMLLTICLGMALCGGGRRDGTVGRRTARDASDLPIGDSSTSNKAARSLVRLPRNVSRVSGPVPLSPDSTPVMCGDVISKSICAYFVIDGVSRIKTRSFYHPNII
ncbi:protein E20A [Elephant endotheliotropic herpesvirus 3B]|nr:protein E20A [Elephant endotheliotropic herpesvirus 3B]